MTDFGLSVMKGVGHDSMMMDFCGTPMYMGTVSDVSKGIYNNDFHWLKITSLQNVLLL